jgi:DNA gyrase/topoisomerase IV subunit B
MTSSSIKQDLIKRGHFHATPPLYKIKKGTEVYCWTEQATPAPIEEWRKGKIRNPRTRYKGLGERTPRQLWETTMNRKPGHFVRYLSKTRRATHFQMADGRRSSAARQFIETMRVCNIDA